MKQGVLLALVLAAVAVPPLPAADLGRLFLSPAERAALDRARRAAATPLVVAPVAEPAPLAPLDQAPVPPPAPLAVDGLVARSAGAPTVWVNGVEAGTGELDAAGLDAGRIRVDGARVRVPLASGGGVMLKPGQRFDPATESVSDAYQQDRAP